MNRREIQKRKKRNKKRKMVRKVFVFSILFILVIITLSLSKINRNNNILEVDEITAMNIKSDVVENNNYIICIDAGHGHWDNGAQGIMGALEKDVNLSVALELGNILSLQNNISVIYTRDIDVLLWNDNSRDDLYSRVEYSNNNNADLFISIHCNSSDYEEYSGVETWYKPYDSNSENLALSIQQQLVSLNYTEDRGIKEYSVDEPLIVIEHNNATSVLVELGFLSNYYDESILSSHSFKSICASAISDGIIQYIESY